MVELEVPVTLRDLLHEVDEYFFDLSVVQSTIKNNLYTIKNL